MPKCPECGKNIESLVHSTECRVMWDFTIDRHGNGDYDNREVNDEWGNSPEYDCPECGYTISTNESRAIEFLEQKDDEELDTNDIAKINADIHLLDLAIAKWKDNAEGQPLHTGMRDCPLCLAYAIAGRDCTGCPVFRDSGSRCCEDTPYETLNNTLNSGTLSIAHDDGLLPEHRYLAQNEVEYLERVRDELIALKLNP